uniref:Uncharacterized protein n=1 Tax=Tanacetum cinerariifolium TaxID=118510 RepID=A0A699GMZ7_TANCI|nr:hypothetical protein [Tanacetum cinerariifolium]
MSSLGQWVCVHVSASTMVLASRVRSPFMHVCYYLCYLTCRLAEEWEELQAKIGQCTFKVHENANSCATFSVQAYFHFVRHLSGTNFRYHFKNDCTFILLIYMYRDFIHDESETAPSTFLTPAADEVVGLKCLELFHMHKAPDPQQTPADFIAVEVKTRILQFHFKKDEVGDKATTTAQPDGKKIFVTHKKQSQSQVPHEPKGKSIDTSEGTGLKPGVLDVFITDSSENSDDETQHADDERTDSKNQETNDDDEATEDKFVHTPPNYVPNDDEANDESNEVTEEEYERINEDLYGDVNVSLTDAKPADKEKDNEKMIDAGHVHAVVENVDQVGANDTKVISMLDINVQHEVPPTTSTTGVLDSGILTTLQLRVTDLEKDVKELKDVDNSTKVISTIKYEVPDAVKEYIGSSLDDALHKDWFKKSERPPIPDPEWNKGAVYNIFKGTCSSYVKINYNMEECYKALTDQLDWNNPKDKLGRNRLMCSHELYKFSNVTLISLCDTLKDMTNNFDMGYTSVMPRKRWSNMEKKRSRIMIKDIYRHLLDKRLMRSLKKFVGGKEYGEDLRLLQQTICRVLFYSLKVILSYL